MPGGVRTLPGFQYLAGMLDEGVCRLALVGANDVNKTSDIVKGSSGSKPTHRFKCLPTHRACALEVALLGISAG